MNNTDTIEVADLINNSELKPREGCEERKGDPPKSAGTRTAFWDVIQHMTDCHIVNACGALSMVGNSLLVIDHGYVSDVIQGLFR